MIICACGKRLYSMEDVRNAKNTGFALFADCKYCSIRLPVSELWRKTKTQKWVELPPEPRKNKKRLQKP